MKNDSGNLSIDFLAGFTIFMLAFIWVATIIPTLLLGLQANTIDYDAVAYRSGVILVEDPGMPANPPWESYNITNQKDEILRMGLALKKETPNLLSPIKINQFFCSTFTYPDDFQQKVIFGDHPYRFNISISSWSNENFTYQSVGDIKPIGYGYIRRGVKIKQMSNATIDSAMYKSSKNSTIHIFSIELNMTHLIQDEKNPMYQIDPLREPIIINITNLKGALIDPSTPIEIQQINLWRLNPTMPLAIVPPQYRQAMIDGNLKTPTVLSPESVSNNISIVFPANFFGPPGNMATDQSKIFINFTFILKNPNPLNLDWAGDTFINNSYNSQNEFKYDYNPSRVTQPGLKPGIVEVAVW